MPSSADPPFDPNQQSISLDALTKAFAQVMGAEASTSESSATDTERGEPGEPEEKFDSTAMETASLSVTTCESQPAIWEVCPIGPRTILEAMLFVGDPENRPLSSARAAELMRDVAADEIPTLVAELNRRYTAASQPFRIAGDSGGYRMTLRREYQSVGCRLRARARETRLSQAAIDVLALVAYEQPLTSEKLNHMRGKPCSHLLAHLVRRGLLRMERLNTKRRMPHYYTTDRFLRLFNIDSLEDLPRGEDSTPS
jgi:segregation and condensation protein B